MSTAVVPYYVPPAVWSVQSLLGASLRLQVSHLVCKLLHERGLAGAGLADQQRRLQLLHRHRHALHQPHRVPRARVAGSRPLRHLPKPVQRVTFTATGTELFQESIENSKGASS